MLAEIKTNTKNLPDSLQPISEAYPMEQLKEQFPEIQNYSDKYDTSHLSEDELKDMLAQTDGDEQLFVATLGLHRAIHDWENGRLGPNEDPVRLIDSWQDTVDSRREKLGLDKLSEHSQQLHGAA